MVLPFEFLLSKAGLDLAAKPDPQADREAKLKVSLDRKILNVKNYAPDLTHLLLEAVPLTLSLSFLDTSTPEAPADSPAVEDEEDESMDDDDAFP